MRALASSRKRSRIPLRARCHVAVTSAIMSLAMLALLSAPHSSSRHLRVEEAADQQPLLPRSADVVVALSGYFWWMHDFGTHWQVPGCTHKGSPLKCQYISTAHAERTAANTVLQNASALVHEGCWDPAAVDGRYQNLPQVGSLNTVSSKSAALS